MMINEIFSLIEQTKGKGKQKVIEDHKDNELFVDLLEYTYDPYRQYYVISVPKTSLKKRSYATVSENHQWNDFLHTLDRCAAREITGGEAQRELLQCFEQASAENEIWMRKILKRHLNVGASAGTINKVIPKLIKTFKCQLAEKFEDKRVEDQKAVGVEPKLDGARCLAVKVNGACTLYTRGGKKIVICNNTIAKDIEQYAPDNIVLDGELMGVDFRTLMKLLHKEGADDSRIKFHVFDYILYKDWVSQKSTLTCQEAREHLEDTSLGAQSKYIEIVPRVVVSPSEIQKHHDQFVKDGFEGSMIKILDEVYRFRRGHNVMKKKDFLEADVLVLRFEEGKEKLEGMLGALVVDHKGVTVNVGSGFSDEERKEIWNNRSKYRKVFVEVRYQEETPDGSLRFPTFVRWRPDK